LPVQSRYSAADQGEKAGTELVVTTGIRFSTVVSTLPHESEIQYMHWRQKTACRDEDPDLFFPIGMTGPALEQAERAKAVCGRCEVSDQCLAWALKTNQQDGVWGGLTEDERRSLRRRQRRRRATGLGAHA
jgi:WhiB family redox-sensing transcriptional regulator